MRRTINWMETRKISRGKPMPKGLERGFREKGWDDKLVDVYTRAAELFNDNASASNALYTHLQQLLPCIAFYETLQEITGSREAALAFLDEWAFVEIKKLMPVMRGIMKLGFYRLMPSLCEKMLHTMFGEEAGFQSREVPGAKKFARDMTVCPYVETCRKYGCPELTRFACQADDITYGNLHPKLVWARTQTLGTGGECCDFRLYLKEE